jgi:hypothetical protein
VSSTVAAMTSVAPASRQVPEQRHGQQVGEDDAEIGDGGHRCRALECIGARHGELGAAAAESGAKQGETAGPIRPAPDRQRQRHHGGEADEGEVEHDRLVTLAGADAPEPEQRERKEHRPRRGYQRDGPGDRERRPHDRQHAREGQRHGEGDVPAHPLAQEGSREQGDEDRRRGPEREGVTDGDATRGERVEAGSGRERPVDAPAPGTGTVRHPERPAGGGGQAAGEECADEEAHRGDLGPRQVPAPQAGAHVHHREASLGDDHPAEAAGPVRTRRGHGTPGAVPDLSGSGGDGQRRRCQCHDGVVQS